MKYNGELEEKDTLRLLRTLRFVRQYLDEATLTQIVCRAKSLTYACDGAGDQQLMIATDVIPEEAVEFTLGEIVDKVLHEYRDYE